MKRNEYQTLAAYERGDLCACGKPVRHASGRCWDCLPWEDKYKNEREETLQAAGLVQLDTESRSDFLFRVAVWGFEKTTLRRMQFYRSAVLSRFGDKVSKLGTDRSKDK